MSAGTPFDTLSREELEDLSEDDLMLLIIGAFTILGEKTGQGVVAEVLGCAAGMREALVIIASEGDLN